MKPYGSHQPKVDVLIAEDNDVNQIIYCEALKDSGLTYRIVENGLEAVSLFEKLQPSVICMDISMPVMGGYAAAQKIREIEQVSNLLRTPIIGITAHALVGDRKKCIESGMDDYIAKPMSPSLFLTKVTSWLKSESANNAL